MFKPVRNKYNEEKSNNSEYVSADRAADKRHDRQHTDMIRHKSFHNGVSDRRSRRYGNIHSQYDHDDSGDLHKTVHDFSGFLYDKNQHRDRCAD